MKFVKVSSPQPVIDHLTAQLVAALQNGQQVLWLVPGGSAIGVAVAVAKNLAGVNTNNLHISLTDERYGEVNHTDSNWKQLLDQGFAVPGANLHPVLTGHDRATTTQAYAATLAKLLEQCQVRIGFFGIGPDGHTAGILPGSSAVTATAFAADYDANFERITMTPPAIAKLTEAVVYATGEAKWPVFDSLPTTRAITDQPAQALKTIEKLTIFNDHIQSEETEGDNS